MSTRPALRRMYSASYFQLFQLKGSFHICPCLRAMISVTLILKITAHKACGQFDPTLIVQMLEASALNGREIDKGYRDLT